MKLHLDNIKEESRLFFVVGSNEKNPELFETYGEAVAYYRTISEHIEALPRVRVCLVNNVYKDGDSSGWNYEDHADTFTEVGTLCEHNEGIE